MSRFEFISVLISLFLALGAAELTLGWGRMLQMRDQVRFSVLHGYWSALLLVLMIQFWWGFWKFSAIEDWTIFGLSLIALEALTLVLCMILLTPSRVFHPPLDLDRLYFTSAKPLFLLGASLMVQFIIADAVLMDYDLVRLENALRAAAAILLLILAWTSNRTAHIGFAVATLVMISVFLSR